MLSEIDSLLDVWRTGYSLWALCLPQVKVIFFSEEISREGRGTAGNSARPVYTILSHAP